MIKWHMAFTGMQCFLEWYLLLDRRKKDKAKDLKQKPSKKSLIAKSLILG